MARRRPSRQKPLPMEPPSPSIARPPHLPSDSWPSTHPSDYSATTHELASSIHYLALRNKCMNLRNGRRCVISPKYHLGANNLVREIVFEDGVVWIAMFARLDSDGEFSRQERLMRRLRGTIPVPQVYAYSDQAQELGGRYIIMEGICGRRADAPYLMFGIPDQHWHTLIDQLGKIMAEGMNVSWNEFTIDGKTYPSDLSFWIEPAEKNILQALKVFNQERPIFDSGHWSNFIQSTLSSIHLLFSELIYLCCNLLTPSRRPADSRGRFPSHLPSLSMENIIFDDEYNIKGLIGFPRTEAVTSWDYFQLPLGLEEEFENTSTRNTANRMRLEFVQSWRQHLPRTAVRWEGLDRWLPWCKKDLVELLYCFRTGKPAPVSLDKFLAEMYHFGSDLGLDLLRDAHLFTTLALLIHYPVAWESDKCNFHVEMFSRLVSMDGRSLSQIGAAGNSLREGKFDFQKLHLPTFAEPSLTTSRAGK